MRNISAALVTLAVMAIAGCDKTVHEAKAKPGMQPVGSQQALCRAAEAAR